MFCINELQDLFVQVGMVLSSHSRQGNIFTIDGGHGFVPVPGAPVSSELDSSRAWTAETSLQSCNSGRAQAWAWAQGRAWAQGCQTGPACEQMAFRADTMFFQSLEQAVSLPTQAPAESH